MKFEQFEQLADLSPLVFFTLAIPLQHVSAFPQRLSPKKHLLPNTEAWLGESSFARVTAAWHAEGLLFEFEVDKALEQSLYPDFTEGDSLELFLDTRDLKNAKYLTRFCHHFLILPQEVQGISSQEITRFPSEDNHPLCDPALIQVTTELLSSKYRMRVQLPAACLHGYDPRSFDRLGFTYRLNRYQGEPQHFSVSSDDYPLERYPALWSTLYLVGL